MAKSGSRGRAHEHASADSAATNSKQNSETADAEMTLIAQLYQVLEEVLGRVIAIWLKIGPGRFSVRLY